MPRALGSRFTELSLRTGCYAVPHHCGHVADAVWCVWCPQSNDLQMIVRAHECVMDGFERFAQGHLITLFSATNYCGTANNAGAILVLGRDLVMVRPKALEAETSPWRRSHDGCRPQARGPALTRRLAPCARGQSVGAL